MIETESNEAARRPVPGIGPASGLRRFGRGLVGLALIPFFLAGRWVRGKAEVLDDPAREVDGLTLVLTGVQGLSFLEKQIALGLADAGVPGRIQVVDWTTGNPLKLIYHLRTRSFAAAAAGRLAERIAEFRRAHPDRPVHVVGYSGGGYVTLQLLEQLPPDVTVTSAALLAPSCSPFLDVGPLAAKTERGLTSVRSPFDFAVLGLLTCVAGTTDGWHAPAAGFIGFHPEGLVLPGEEPTGAATKPTGRYRELVWRAAWIRQFHYGMHFGYANRVWACETLGRLFVEDEVAAGERPATGAEPVATIVAAGSPGPDGSPAG